jgi:hypothetical protein
MRYIPAASAFFLVLAASGVFAQVPSWGVVAQGKWGTVWTASPMNKIMRDTPVPTSKPKAARIYAAKNEFEPFQIVLTPKTRLGNIKILPHTLSGPQKATIPAWNITVKNVEYVNCTQPTSKEAKPGFYPDPLPDYTPFDAPASRNTPVWVTIYVSSKTAAGEYKGSVDVVSDGAVRVSVPVVVRVFDFALPSVSRLRTAYGNGMGNPYAYQGATTLDQQRKLVELYNLDFFKHRVSPYSPYAAYDLKVGEKDGSVSIDFTDFDVAIQKFFPYVNSFMLPRFGMGDDVGFGKGPDADRMKIDYMRRVAEHLTDKGVLTKGYDYITDEPQPDAYESIAQAAKDVRLADQRIKILLTKKVEDKLIGSVDIWVPIVDQYDEQASRARQAKGEQVWWYLCTGPKAPYANGYFIDYPAIDMRMYHWQTWRYGLNGILYWETTYWQDNPWQIPMSQPPGHEGYWGNGDGHLLYPPTEEKSDKFVAKGPVDSIRWEMVRDGIEDWDYFRTLQDRIDAASPAKKATPAYAAAVDAMKQVNGCVRSLTDFCTDTARVESIRVKVGEAIEGMK